jgi:hypothetical protein
VTVEGHVLRTKVPKERPTILDPPKQMPEGSAERASLLWRVVGFDLLSLLGSRVRAASAPRRAAANSAGVEIQGIGRMKLAATVPHFGLQNLPQLNSHPYFIIRIIARCLMVTPSAELRGAQRR